MYNNPCTKTISKGYASKVVIIEKSKVFSYELIDDLRIKFKLKSSNVGKEKKIVPVSMFINGTTIVSSTHNIPRYTHNIQLPIYGNDVDAKQLIDDLKRKEYYACLYHASGIVEVFGFEFGLNLVDFTLDGNNGGGMAQLRSEEPEFTAPLIYVSDSPLKDFENNFGDGDVLYSAFSKAFSTSSFN